ncbi:MAG: tetratricopeptide repeat protein, partial [Candidatus Poseidoniaceae archaeon]
MTESEVVAEAPDVSDLLREGEALSRGRNYVEALDRFNRAIAMDPSSSMAWYNRGVLLEGQRDAKGAKQSFTICLDLEPDHAPATANLAVLLERMGDTEGAGAMATRALTHYPDHPELLDIRRRC